VQSTLVQRLLAEAIGAFTLVFAGAGALTVNSVAGDPIPPLGIALAFGLALMVMVFAVGHISGGHFNPAVTTGLALTRNFPWRDAPAYYGAQLAGTVVASLLLRGIFGTDGRAAVTLPRDGFLVQAFLLEIVMTFFLVYVICGVATDNRAVGPAALAIGFTITMDALFGGPISGASMNPARSLGPALVALEFKDQWLYIVAPLIGGALGALAYQVVRGTMPAPGALGAAQPAPPVANPPNPQRRRRN
jgi:aquaporin NIP